MEEKRKGIKEVRSEIKKERKKKERKKKERAWGKGTEKKK